VLQSIIEAPLNLGLAMVSADFVVFTKVEIERRKLINTEVFE